MKLKLKETENLKEYSDNPEPDYSNDVEIEGTVTVDYPFEMTIDKHWNRSDVEEYLKDNFDDFIDSSNKEIIEMDYSWTGPGDYADQQADEAYENSMLEDGEIEDKPKITAYSIAQFEADRLHGKAEKLESDNLFGSDVAKVYFNFNGRHFSLELILKELGSSINLDDSEEATQPSDIAKKEEYKKMVTPEFKVGKKFKESYDYIGKDTGEPGRNDKSHMEHTYTVYDCFGEVETFKSREEAEQYIEDHKDDDLYTEEYGVFDGPQFRIEEDDIEVLNHKIVVKDDLE